MIMMMIVTINYGGVDVIIMTPVNSFILFFLASLVSLDTNHQSKYHSVFLKLHLFKLSEFLILFSVLLQIASSSIFFFFIFNPSLTPLD